MKRLAILIATAVVLVTTTHAERVVQTYTGTVPISLSLHDSTGFKTSGFVPIQISEMVSGQADMLDVTWDAIFGTFYLANLTELSTDSSAEGACDTLILNYKVGSQWYNYTVESDTGTLPATEFFCWLRDPTWDVSTVTTSDSVEGWGWGFPKLNPSGDLQAFLQDQFYLEYYVEDSSAGTGRLSGSLMYYLKCVKF